MKRFPILTAFPLPVFDIALPCILLGANSFTTRPGAQQAILCVPGTDLVLIGRLLESWVCADVARCRL